MTEFQFNQGTGVTLDVHAETPEEAVTLVNSQLHHFDNGCLAAPGLIQRICIGFTREFTASDIVQAYALPEVAP